MSSDQDRVQVMDTTLRDGEQMKNVSYPPEEKLALAKMLLQSVGVDRVEIASARVSKGEEAAVRRIIEWAKSEGLDGRVEILGFVDGGKSVDWLVSQGARVMNLLAKGSLKHCVHQLKKTREEHVRDIRDALAYAESRGVTCNLYLEDWSNGMLHSPEYVYFLLEELAGSSVQRFLLPDTLGVLYPRQVLAFASDVVKRFPGLSFDFHGHNDYGLAVANTLAAVEAGIRCVHCTVNGMGERAGNTPLDETVIGIHDFLGLSTNVDEKELFRVSQAVEAYSGCRVPFNKPISGSNVFTQTAGIHADGDKKGNLYHTRLMPERFDRKRQYALGKLSGKSSLDYNLEKLGISLTPEQKRTVLDRIVELGDRKESITDDDLPYIVTDVLDTPEEKRFTFRSCVIVTSMDLKPMATIKVIVRDPESGSEQELESSAQGDGGYDAFMNALHGVAHRIAFPLPKLVDYAVSIPPGGKTDALVRCAITWRSGEALFMTKGVNSDQVMAAIEATEKMMNLTALQKGKAEGGSRQKP
ncbi:MAG: alpha-isopropylmalate synthase regulatory domain-containing protein [bacterium]|nr:alpha-isopropylmalate synthase regulatory domain-containing protein [bacterium]